MKTKFFLITLLIASLSFAQATKNVEESLIKVNFINPGIEYEWGFAKNQTFDVSAALQFGARGGSDRGFDWALIPAFNASYKYFYNLNRRKEKGKRIRGNSGNFIALNNTTFLNETIIGNLNVTGGYFGQLGPVYGIQRTYSKGFNFSLKMGFGYYYDDFYEGEFGPILGFSIGWVLGKSK
ncbi:hypothetical protein ACFSQJ_03565 [Croceitalea marina]|uniref:DUF3575 domain-containing protein n=1 Tax=Croceitalea marina TaxID=1775166 RepID=A0ABW5MUI1_9FLAO